MSFPDSGAQQSAAMHAHLEQVAEHGALGAALLQLQAEQDARADAIRSLVTQTLELVKVQGQVRRVRAIVDGPVPVVRVRAARVRAALKEPAP